MQVCKQCGKLFKKISNTDVICESCKKENEKEIIHFNKGKNLNTCISKIFLIDNVVYQNYFLPLLVKYKINQSEAIRILIEYAVSKPEILLKKENKSNIDKFVEYFINNADNKISKTTLRATKFVNGNKFKSFFAENYKEIKEKLRLRGYELLQLSGTKNSKFYMLLKK